MRERGANSLSNDDREDNYDEEALDDDDSTGIILASFKDF